MASGDTLLVFGPQQGQPPATNYATLDSRNNQLVLDFDDTTEESTYFSGVLPRNYGGGGITATLWWMATSATSGDVKAGVSFERHQDSVDDLDADGFGSEQTGTITAPATSGTAKAMAIASTNGAQIDSIAVGETFRMKVARKAADAADTMTGDAELLAVELKET